MTPPFADKPFEERMKSLGGDLAENAFVDFAEKKEISYQRYGFDRSDLTGFYDLPLFVRKTPDYVCSKGGKSFLVEAKGCGRGDRVNLKVSDLKGMTLWSTVLPLYIFVFDSDTDKISLIKLEQLAQALKNPDTYRREKWKNDGVEYFAISKSVFDWKHR